MEILRAYTVVLSVIGAADTHMQGEKTAHLYGITVQKLVNHLVDKRLYMVIKVFGIAGKPAPIFCRRADVPDM